MKKIALLIIYFLSANCLHAQVRQIINFNNDWKFYLGNDSTASNVEYADENWRTLTLPHDWSIEGNFAKENPATTQGGALPGGIGWYRKTFSIPATSKNKNISIEFDGVYKNSEVWINGHYLGKRPNGYISFQYDLTPYLKFGKEKNIIAVKVDNSQQPNSRWYSGSGIYRDVKLIAVNPYASVKQWRAFVTASDITKDKAIVSVATNLNSTINGWKSVSLYFDIYDNKNKLISGGDKFDKRRGVMSFNGIRMNQVFSTNIFNPKLWSVDNPYLYKLVIRVVSKGKLVDIYETSFGIRSIRFDREKGFFLNEQPLKIKGVCMHHDLGALGAAFNSSAAERQLLILKEMGCNAIRTAHNPPAPAFLDLCDKMGFLVMDEAFDIWQKKKNKFDYSLDFAAWHKKDLQDLILRDRNHPSVFMWSIGNEIREQFDSTGIALTKELVDIVKQLDNTRPVTAALTETDTAKNFIYQANALDVLGWNYNDRNYADFLTKYPNQIFIASETNSAIATRGYYDMPSDSVRVWPAKGKKEIENVNGDWTVSAYDNVKAGWGSTHEETWKIIKKYDFLSGMFVWTGFDYLGEPTPYPWPARSSYFGIVDLAGFPKDSYYMYQSEWTTKPVLHIFPHWTPEKIGKDWPLGKLIDVWAYYNNADEVELFLNGKSLGIQKKLNDDLHVMWRVPFEPGTLKAISKKDGKIVLQKEIKTAGAPYKIELIEDKRNKYNDSNALTFITARVVDKNGNLVPNANNLIEFSISSNASIVATDNGYQADTTAFFSTKRQAWKGMALAMVKKPFKKTNSTLMAMSEGLLSGTIALKMP
jgi:beta-galactosidase